MRKAEIPARKPSAPDPRFRCGGIVFERVAIAGFITIGLLNGVAAVYTVL